jgi:putative selenium metabolism hydrolase
LIIFIKIIFKLFLRGVYIMKANVIKDFIDNEKSNLLDALCEFVETESLTGNEEEIVKKVEIKMRDMKFDEVFIDKIGNVIGRIGNGDKIIVYDAHLDTVAADIDEWDTHPFQAVVKDDNIFGRGTMDDKGPFTSMLFAGKAIKELGLYDDFTIYIVGSISEEDCEGLALESFIKEYNLKPDYVVIAEASDLKICRGHRGRALLEANFNGTPVHASIHNEGDNPIEKALPFIEAISKLDKTLSEDKELGRGDIVVTNIECKSSSLNTLPSKCKVIMDRRTNSLDDKESILKELKELPGANDARIDFLDYEERSYNNYPKKAEEYFPAWVLSKDHPLVKAGEEAYEKMFSEKPVVTVWGFSTNGTYTMGKEGIPTLGFGPGKEKYAHGKNERVAINDLVKAAMFYAYLPSFL